MDIENNFYSTLSFLPIFDRNYKLTI